MKRKYIYPLLVILATILFYYSEDYLDQKKTGDKENLEENENTSFFYLPTSTTNAIINHRYYTLSYAEDHEQAEWVAYHLKREHIVNSDYKRPYFEIDKKVRTGAADWRNYKQSGYDRGHLCPAADREFSKEAFEETFLTSNISPQNHEFNSGIWNDLEQKVRYWAKRHNGLYVVTGGVLKKDLQTIGYEAVSVPNYFYKVLLTNDLKNPKMIAFLVPHRETNASLASFVVPTDQIEQLTGIDFFASLEDPIEDLLEASDSLEGWRF